MYLYLMYYLDEASIRPFMWPFAPVVDGSCLQPVVDRVSALCFEPPGFHTLSRVIEGLNF